MLKGPSRRYDAPISAKNMMESLSLMLWWAH